MRVLLLGAGASKSYDQSPTGQRMPVARDFFETFDKLELSANLWVLIGSIVAYVEDELGAESAHAFLRSGIDIEDLHSRIEADRDEKLRTKGLLAAMVPYKAFNELVFLFAAVLNDIQNGPPSSAHIRLVESLHPHDVIITFNWDTLVDRVLAERSEWRPDWGYGVAPRAIFNDGWVDPQDSRHAKGNLLLKLHGSTNWLTAYSVTDGEGKIVPGQELDPAAFGVFERATRPYACFKGRFMGGYQPYSYGYYPPNLDFPGRPAPEGYTIVSITPTFPWMKKGSAPDAGLVSMPLIIPPVKNKSYEFFGDLFKALWLRAEDALAAADDIVIIGYSFPKTDVQSDHLFRQAFAKRTTLPKVTIVDPDPNSVAERMRKDLGIPDNRLRVIQDYFSGDLDLQTVLNSASDA
jgi:hypothetical protein